MSKDLFFMGGGGGPNFSIRSEQKKINFEYFQMSYKYQTVFKKRVVNDI